MKTQSQDTSPAAEQAQIEILRRLGTRGRIARMRSLTRSTQRLARRALRQARPELNERQLIIEWVRINYGEELAQAMGKVSNDV